MLPFRIYIEIFWPCEICVPVLNYSPFIWTVRPPHNAVHQSERWKKELSLWKSEGERETSVTRMQSVLYQSVCVCETKMKWRKAKQSTAQHSTAEEAASENFEAESNSQRMAKDERVYLHQNIHTIGAQINAIWTAITMRWQAWSGKSVQLAWMLRSRNYARTVRTLWCSMRIYLSNIFTCYY